MIKMDFETLRDSLCQLIELDDPYFKLIMYNPRSREFEEDAVVGWIELYSEILQEAQRKCIYRAVCLCCRPRGVYHNLMRYAQNFADEAVKEIDSTDLYYEIGSFYTKDHCPVTVEFEL